MNKKVAFARSKLKNQKKIFSSQAKGRSISILHMRGENVHLLVVKQMLFTLEIKQKKANIPNLFFIYMYFNGFAS